MGAKLEKLGGALDGKEGRSRLDQTFLESLVGVVPICFCSIDADWRGGRDA